MLASAADGVVALGRISKYLIAEELVEPYAIQSDSEYAVDIEGDFTWETAKKPQAAGKSGKDAKKGSAKTEEPQKQGKKRRSLFGGDKKGDVLPTVAPVGEKEKVEESEEKPFELKNLNFKVRKGAFVAIVGTVGSGKVGQRIS